MEQAHTATASDEQILGPRLTRVVDICLGTALAIVFFSLTAALSL
jgi:hypothetical protein